MAKPKWPFPLSKVVSDFGDKKNRTAPHTGIDFGGVGNGAPIRAGGKGKVHFAGEHNARAGNVVSIRYDGIKGTAMYCHVQARYPLKKGKRVKAGDIIAYVGSSGSASGPHLHLGMFLDPGTLVNPRSQFSGELSAVAGDVTYSKAHWVKVQKLLIALGYDLGRWGADGKPGPFTDAAVRSFQDRADITVDGLPGSNTVRELDRAVAALTKPAEPQPDPVPPVAAPDPVDTEPVETVPDEGGTVTSPPPPKPPQLSGVAGMIAAALVVLVSIVYVIITGEPAR